MLALDLVGSGRLSDPSKQLLIMSELNLPFLKAEFIMQKWLAQSLMLPWGLSNLLQINAI